VTCPYKGLRAFEHEDAALFFGREAQADRVLVRLAEVRFAAIVGASGSGKSSFVRAGLLASINASAANEGTSTCAVVLTPGEHPLDELATAVSATNADAARRLSERLRGNPASLAQAITETGQTRFVIVIDQFEELFTLCDDEAERRCLVNALIGAWRDPASSVVVILALRADFYGRVAAYPELAAAVVAHQTLIGPMSQTDLRRAIELPAAQSRLVLQPGLVQTMLEDLADEPGALPLLSHALLETWKRRRRLTLTVGGYREAGGVRGAIAQTAERTLQTLSGPDRATARSIFLSLTEIGEGAEPTRRRVDRTELAGHPQSAESLNRVLGILADARLVTIDERTVVVAHEALIRHWPRLRGWIDADREGLLIHRRLSEAAREWDGLRREPGALYRGARLAAAREWASDYADDLSGLESDFLTASLKVVQRRTRRLRVLATGFAALATLVTVLAVWALDQRSRARQQTTEATSLALASSALPLLDTRPDVSLLLALEAYRASPRREARDSALAALTAAHPPGLMGILHGQGRAVRSVVFSPDGRTLASGGLDKTVRLWDVRTHKQRGAPLNGHQKGVASVAFSPDGRTLASAGADGTVRLWDVGTHRQRGAALTGHKGIVLTVAFSPDGRTLASAGADRTVRLWDVRSHRQRGRSLTGHANFVVSVAFSPDGRTLASAGDEGTIRLWSVSSHRQRGRPLTDQIQAVFSVAFSPDGRTLAAGGQDGSVRLWNVRERKRVGKFDGGFHAVQSVAFSHDGRTLASGGEDKAVRLWDVSSHKQVGPALSGHTDVVRSVAFSPDGTLASASDDTTIRLWNTRLIRRTQALTDIPLVHDGALSPDRRLLAIAGTNVQLWDVPAATQHGRLPTQAFGVAFSPDGRTLASASDDDKVRFWDVHSRTERGPPLPGHTQALGVAFSPDGRTLASGSKDGTVRLWDVHSRTLLGRALTGHTDAVSRVAFSPDGRTLASASDDDDIRLWNVSSRKPRGGPLSGHTARVGAVAFSPDGRILAAGSDDNTIRLWNAHTHKPLGQPLKEGDTASVESLAFSPDGRTLASGRSDNTVRLWDMRERKAVGKPLTSPTADLSFDNSAVSVGFSPDGRTLMSGGDVIRIWTRILWRNRRELQTEVCKLLGSGLTKAEWARYAARIIPYRQTCP